MNDSGRTQFHVVCTKCDLLFTTTDDDWVCPRVGCGMKGSSALTLAAYKTVEHKPNGGLR